MPRLKTSTSMKTTKTTKVRTSQRGAPSWPPFDYHYCRSCVSPFHTLAGRHFNGSQIEAKMIKEILLEDIEPRVSDFSSPEFNEGVERIVGSLNEIGFLLHPITVLELSKTESGVQRYRIHAGDKRYYAHKRLARRTILSFIVPPDTPPERIEEIALHENLKRANLPWYDIVEMERQLHEMRQKSKGKGRQGAKVGWSLRDTAEELVIGLGTLSEDLRMAEAVLQNPNLKKIQDKTTARRIIMNSIRREVAETEASQPVKFETNTVYLGDSATILAEFPSGSFDCCFTDPPWLKYKDEKLVKDESTLPVFKEVFRVLKMGSIMYVICSTPDFYIYQIELAKIGFTVSQMPLIWHKQNTVSHGNRPWEYNRDYEPILLAAKGAAVLAINASPSSVYSSPAVHPTKLIHPNEKPVDVPEHFLAQSTFEGSIILDPFGGSGVTAEACKKLGRRYVIVERDRTFYKRINDRLAAIA